MEAFKPLEQFLCSCRDQLEVEIHQAKFDMDRSELHGLIKQSNLLGTIIRLPGIVKAVKDQFDEVERRSKQAKEASFDPLNLEGA
jgi:hypothetical protein